MFHTHCHFHTHFEFFPKRHFGDRFHFMLCHFMFGVTFRFTIRWLQIFILHSFSGEGHPAFWTRSRFVGHNFRMHWTGISRAFLRIDYLFFIFFHRVISLYTKILLRKFDQDLFAKLLYKYAAAYDVAQTKAPKVTPPIKNVFISMGAVSLATPKLNV